MLEKLIKEWESKTGASWEVPDEAKVLVNSRRVSYDFLMFLIAKIAKEKK